MPLLPRRPRGVLIDLDGTVYDGDRPIPGAAESLTRLRERLPIRFLTNTTRAPRRVLVERLGAMGVSVEVSELFTAPMAAAAWLRRNGVRRVALCLPAHTAEEFQAFDIVTTRPEVVLVGDLGHEWTYARVNDAFRWLTAGARLVALHRNRFWKTAEGLAVDAGAYVAALEFSAGVQATIVGKPSRDMFEAAAASMDVAARDVVMVGDDLVSDVGGAQAAGAMGVLVRTGKFTPDQLDGHRVRPDLVLDSVADLPPAIETAS